MCVCTGGGGGVLSLTDGFTLVVLYACIVVVVVGARHVLEPITYAKCTRSGIFYMYASACVCVLCSTVNIIINIVIVIVINAEYRAHIH